MGKVHSKRISNVGTEVAGASSVTERLIRIVDEESIARSQQGDSCGFLIVTRIPDSGTGGLHAHVLGHSVGFLVQTAGCHNVHSCRGHGDGCVVPDEGDVLSDLVVGCRSGVRGEHGDATRASSRVDRDRGRGGG